MVPSRGLSRKPKTERAGGLELDVWGIPIGGLAVLPLLVPMLLGNQKGGFKREHVLQCQCDLLIARGKESKSRVACLDSGRSHRRLLVSSYQQRNTRGRRDILMHSQGICLLGEAARTWLLPQRSFTGITVGISGKGTPDQADYWTFKFCRVRQVTTGFCALPFAYARTKVNNRRRSSELAQIYIFGLTCLCISTLFYGRWSVCVRATSS